MSGGFPTGLQVCNGTDNGTSASTSSGTNVTPGSTANTKGSFAQLVASTAVDASWIGVSLASGGGLGGFLFDIAIGGAGSEIVIIPNLTLKNATGLEANAHYSFPIDIPAGTRLSARAQSNTAADNPAAVIVTLYDGDMVTIEGCAGVDAIGASTTTSQGSQVDAGAVANTKGAYTQLVASSAVDYIGFVIGFDNQNGGGTTSNAQLIDIAVGGAGSEQVIVPNYVQRRTNSGTDNMVTTSSPIFIPIPSGTRISARSQSGATTSPDRLAGVAVYGIYQ